MSTSASVFPFTQIALTAALTAGGGLLVLTVLRPHLRGFSLVDSLLIVVITGLSVLVWRSVGNTGALNDDRVPGVSPNDVLCPLVTYLFLGFFAAFWRPADPRRFEQIRVWLTLVSFAVNVITI